MKAILFKGSIMCIINVNCVRLLDRIYLSYSEWKKWKIRGCTTLLIHRVCHDNNNNIPSPHPLFSKRRQQQQQQHHHQQAQQLQHQQQSTTNNQQQKHTKQNRKYTTTTTTANVSHSPS